MPLHPRTSELLDYLDRELVALRATVDAVPLELRARRPSSDAWSVDDVITHLVETEASIAALLARMLSEARAAGLPGETDDSSIVAAFKPERIVDRSAKLASPSRYNPLTTGAARGWAEYEEVRRALRQVVVDSSGFAIGTLSYPHRYFGPLNLYEWIAFTAAHAARHGAQIEEIVARAADVPGTTSGPAEPRA